MRNKLIATMAVIFCIGLSYIDTAGAANKQYPAVTVGIVKPVAIPAMTEIVNGFKQQLTASYPGHIHYIVANAQGDLNIMRSIFQQFKEKKVDLVVPIGTAAAQMADSVNRNQPIVALAAEFKDVDRAKFKNKNITNILDEIDINKQIHFIHTAFPELKYITIIYGTEPQVQPEAKQATAAAKHYGIKVQKLLVTSLPKLYTVSKHISPHSQAIFILKDELIVSGINTLIKQAAKKHLLLIASDDGSVKKGADFAVGVSERLIGIGGAKLAMQVLKGTTASSIPVKIMKHYHVYVSPHYENGIATQTHLNFARVKKAAEKFNYPIETLSTTKE